MNLAIHFLRIKHKLKTVFTVPYKSKESPRPYSAEFYDQQIAKSLIPEPASRSTTPGVSPVRGLLFLRCENHPPLCVGLHGLVWTFDLLADVIKFRGWSGD